MKMASATPVSGNRSTVTIALDSNSESLRPRIVDELIEILSPSDIPLIKLIGFGEEFDGPKIEWMTDDILKEKVAMVGSCTLGASTTVLDSSYIATSDIVHFQVGTLLRCPVDGGFTTQPSVWEYMWVTDKTVDTSITVIRGVYSALSGTGVIAEASQHVEANLDDTDSAYFEIVGLALAENIDTPTKGTLKPEFYYNLFQIFDQKYQTSWRQENTKMLGSNQSEDEQLAKAMLELNVKLENSIMFGHRQTTTAGVPPTFGGVDYWLTSHVTDMNAAALEEKDLLDVLQTLYYDVGPSNMAKTILCGPWVKRKINSWYSPSLQMTRKETKGGVIIDQVETDFGTIGVKMLNRIPASRAYLVNLDMMSIHPYKGHGRWEDSELSRQGPYTVHELYGDYSFKVKNERAMAVIKEISTIS
jgi:hypothetical protein